MGRTAGKNSIPSRERGAASTRSGRLTAEELQELARAGEVAALGRGLGSLHPADLADLFESLDQELWSQVLQQLEISAAASVLAELPDSLRAALAGRIPLQQLAGMLEQMTSDDAADVLADLPAQLANQLLEALPREDQRGVESLLAYPEDTAGGLMQVELIAVTWDASVDQAVEAVRGNAEQAGILHFVYVVDDNNRLLGVLKLTRLILARGSTPVRELIDHDILAVTPLVDQEEVAWMFRRYDLVALPVIDEGGHLLGQVIHDDAIDVLAEEASEDILQMAGVQSSEPEVVYSDRLVKIAAARLPWLLATLAGLKISALLYWRFQLTFPQLLALIPFIPVISAMGGNMGAQSSTIVVRGFAIGRVDFHNLGRVLSRELLVGCMIGVVCGTLTGVLAVFWRGNLLLSLTVASAMVAAIVVAALVGVLVPYLFKWLKVDPAIATGPFVTTLEDILATSIYYLFATLMLKG
jgi:magnesium transporter